MITITLEDLYEKGVCPQVRQVFYDHFGLSAPVCIEAAQSVVLEMDWRWAAFNLLDHVSFQLFRKETEHAELEFRESLQWAFDRRRDLLEAAWCWRLVPFFGRRREEQIERDWREAESEVVARYKRELASAFVTCYRQQHETALTKG